MNITQPESHSNTMANFDFSITIEKNSEYFCIFGPTFPIHKYDMFCRPFYHYPVPNGVVIIDIKDYIGIRRHIIQITNKSEFNIKVKVPTKKRITVKILKPNEVFCPNYTRMSAMPCIIAMRNYKKEH